MKAKKAGREMELEEIRKPVGLYSIFMRRLNEVKMEYRAEVIPFKIVFEKLCRNFSITKKECWDILFLVRDVGFIEIVAFRGIKINL
jgi:hypothetical protein